jgi:aspartate-semialdehyde dehydrogenase
MKIVVVGATGMVGEVMLQVLAERNFISDADELILVAQKDLLKRNLFNETTTASLGYSRKGCSPTLLCSLCGGETSLEGA